MSNKILFTKFQKLLKEKCKSFLFKFSPGTHKLEPCQQTACIRALEASTKKESTTISFKSHS